MWLEITWSVIPLVILLFMFAWGAKLYFVANRPPADAPMLDGMHRSRGGLLRASVAVDLPRQHLKQVWITGDFFVKPRRVVLDLEAALKDTPLVDLERNIETFFARSGAEMLLLAPEDFVTVIRNAVANASQAREATA